MSPNTETMDSLVPLISVTGGLLCGFFTIVMGGWWLIVRTRAREQTRREIAAYVAEGSISAEDAAKLMEAGGRSGLGCSGSRRPTVIIGAAVGRRAERVA